MLSAEGDNTYRAPGSPGLHAWLCRELKIDFATEWKPSVDFIKEQFAGDDQAALLAQFPDEIREQLGDKPKTADILAAWPAGFVPQELLVVDAKGKIVKGKKSKSKKAG
jgi:hypothetical protein